MIKKIEARFIKLILLIFLLINSSALFSKSVINDSGEIFLPKKLWSKISNYNSFPVSWWNFLIIDYPQGFKTAQINDDCNYLKSSLKDVTSIIICGDLTEQLQSTLSDWIKDSMYRTEAPSPKELQWKLNSTLTKLAYAGSSNNNFTSNLLQNDPFGFHLDFIEIVSKHSKSEKSINGFISVKGSKKIIIPIQIKSAPMESTPMLKIASVLKDNMVLIGPHASNFENKSIIMNDLKTVAIITLALLSFLILYIILTKRIKMFILVPPVALSILISLGLTILFFGNIHGLTISFGVGIIGLAFDYGFHYLLIEDKKRAWKGNFVGLITTLIVLIILIFSNIPLIKQMMFFSLTGLTLSFIFFYIISNKTTYDNKLELPLWPSLNYRNQLIAISLIMVAIIYGFSTTPLNFSLKQFDFQSEDTKSYRNELFSTLKLLPPLFIIHKNKGLNEITKEGLNEKKWSDTNNIRYEGVANYTTTQERQVENYKSWHKAICDLQSKQKNQMAQKVFSNFFKQFDCSSTFNYKKSGYISPSYLNHLRAENNWISLWFPANENENKLVREQFNTVRSLYDLVSVFPQYIIKDLKVAVPLSLCLVFLITLIYFRNFIFTIKSTIPFCTGLAFILLGLRLLNLNINFITIIALLIVYGLSIDYGIFSCNALGTKGYNKKQTNSALTLSAITTISGFIPLVFCQHPVLFNLGFVLTLGTFGALFGSVFLVPNNKDQKV